MKRTLVLLVMPFTLYAQKSGQSLYDTYMEGQVAIYRFNGNVLVAKNGNIIYRRSFGLADHNTKKSLDSNSIFDCGSIAKEFTAMGILLLKDKGKISYTDTLGKFFPELPYTNVTIQQLLTHTSGMPDGFGLVTKHFDHSKIAYNDDLLRLLAREKPPLFFKPGENLAYSGTAFNLLATIIEKITGQSYIKYMEEKVFKPLGMMHTRVANGPRSVKDIPGYAYGFLYSDSLKRNVRSDSLGSGWTSYLAGITGEGMIITTTGDLLRWDRALKNHSLLSETTQREMLSQQSEKYTVPKITFGYGIRVGKNDFGNYVFHNGYYPGYVGMHLRYTEEDITVIVLSNNESRADYIADALSAITLKRDIVLPAVHKETVTGVAVNNYNGKYMMRLARPPYMAVFPVEFVTRNNVLYIHSAFGPDIVLRPESGTKFFFANGTDQQIEFETGMGGESGRVWHTTWGVRRELKKIE
ncbi:MAG TPA: serine hydrolase domain-containing protein [Chitinophagaceae bacterium]